MSKEAVFTMKLEPELRAAFMAEAEALDRPASQVVRELMREFIQKQQESRAYDEFVAVKMARARVDIEAGREVSNEEVATKFGALRAAALRDHT